mmetsp:Transcript_5884/g.21089  ORF Transcript_5884/g.21089 Transcript_5884/m.21089 type:complete len:203 (+) Transcript_5884:463-1071(+)
MQQPAAARLVRHPRHVQRPPHFVRKAFLPRLLFLHAVQPLPVQNQLRADLQSDFVAQPSLVADEVDFAEVGERICPVRCPFEGFEEAFTVVPSSLERRARRLRLLRHFPQAQVALPNRTTTVLARRRGRRAILRLKPAHRARCVRGAACAARLRPRHRRTESTSLSLANLNVPDLKILRVRIPTEDGTSFSTLNVPDLKYAG